jgi:hypothetical protein
VRLFYDYPIYISYFDKGLITTSNNGHLLVATAAFRNEPY